MQHCYDIGFRRERCIYVDGKPFCIWGNLSKFLLVPNIIKMFNIFNTQHMYIDSSNTTPEDMNHSELSASNNAVKTFAKYIVFKISDY